MVNTKFHDATLRQQLDNILRKQEAAVRRAFMMSINDIRRNVTLRQLIDAIEAGDIPRAIRVLNLEPAAYATFSEEIRNTYTQAGAVAMAGTVWRVPDMSKAVVRWDFDNPRARQWLLNWSSTKITGDLIPGQVSAVRSAIEAGYGLGRGPRDIALDIVGRVGANGRRTGGILGLDDQSVKWVSNMEDTLRNDPRSYFTVDKKTGVWKSRFSRSDGNVDKTLRKLVKNGEKIPEKLIQRAKGSYTDRMLQSRGNRIARTETAQAVNAARLESSRQGAEATGLPDNVYIKTWRHGGPAETKARTDHAAMNGVSVRGLNTPFTLPDGTQCQYPLDPILPAEHSINCRCGYFVEIDYKMLAT